MAKNVKSLIGTKYKKNGVVFTVSNIERGLATLIGRKYPEQVPVAHLVNCSLYECIA